MDFSDLEAKVKELLAAPQQMQAMADAAHRTLTDRGAPAAFAADVAAMLRDIEPLPAAIPLLGKGTDVEEGASEEQEPALESSGELDQQGPGERSARVDQTQGSDGSPAEGGDDAPEREEDSALDGVTGIVKPQTASVPGSPEELVTQGTEGEAAPADKHMRKTGDSHHGVKDAPRESEDASGLNGANGQQEQPQIT